MTLPNQAPGHLTPAPEQAYVRPTISNRADAVGLCNRLNECITAMTEVLSAETDLLKQQNTSGIEALQAEKLKHTQAYLVDFNLFKTHAAMVGAEAPVEVNGVRKILASFNTTLEQNLHALAAAKSVSESVVNVIAEAAREAQAGPTCYGANAHVGVEGSHRAAAIAVDKKF